MSDAADLEAALEMVYEAVDAWIARVRRDGAQAMEAGRYDVAQELIARARALESSLQDLRAVGQRILDGTRPPQSEPPVRRTVRERRISAGGPAPRGAKTPDRAYRVPILRALVEAGGAGRAGEILDRVYAMMRDRLNIYDQHLLPSGREERWRNTARWERGAMKKAGLLAADSPAGIWEITEAGRRYLDEHADEA